MISSNIVNISILLFGLYLIYFRIDTVSNGTGFSNLSTIIIILLFLALLVISIGQLIKKRPKAFIILMMLSAFATLFPFEYVFGLASFKFSNGSREMFLKNINHHVYDSLLTKEKYEGEGIRTRYNGKDVFLYKDSNLLAVYFWQSFWLSKEQYCGTLYISDDTKAKDPRIYKFLHRDLEYKKLGRNWYWVKGYIDLEPGP